MSDVTTPTDVTENLTGAFESARTHLRGVAIRMLGSASEADDAVQEAWLRIARADPSAVANLRGWMTMIVARICLDMLRTRKSRREDALATATEPIVPVTASPDAQLAMADSLGVALLVVLETLDPTERLAFVLHDLFGVPFDEIAPIVGRTPAAARQLASRARRRVQGASVPDDALPRHRPVVDAFLAAFRSGDIDQLVAVLHPDLVVRNGERVGRGSLEYARGALPFAAAMQHGRVALIDGALGIAMMSGGKVWRVVHLTIVGDVVTAIEIVMDPADVAALDVVLLDP